MEERTLKNLKKSIEDINVVSDLEDLKNQIVNLITSEVEGIAAQILETTALTNPVTFIAISVQKNLDKIVQLTERSTKLTEDMASVISLISEHSSKLK